MRWQILIAVAFFAGSLHAGAAKPEECDNRAFFERILSDSIEAGNTKSDAARQSNRASLEEALTALTERVDGLCMEALIASAEDDGGFPVVGNHLMLFEMAVLDSGDLLCNRVPYSYGGPAGGPGGHYDEAVEFSADLSGAMPWSYGEKEYAGAASSRFSVAEPGLDVQAYVMDLATGKTFAYAEPIRYVGVSDFYCMHWESGFIHDKFNFNIPFVSGAIVQDLTNALPPAPPGIMAPPDP